MPSSPSDSSTPPSPPQMSTIFRPLSTPAYTALTGSETPSTPPPSNDSSTTPTFAPASSLTTTTPITATKAATTTTSTQTPTSPIIRQLSPTLAQCLPASPSLPPLPQHQQRATQDIACTYPGRDDLGDDDSFTPDIVSGYHFNVPLALDPISSTGKFHHLHHTSTPSSDAHSLSRHHVDLLPDLHDDVKSRPDDRDDDHRTDAIYDDLDDIGDWVASTARHPEAELAKRITRINGTHTVPTSTNSANVMATAALHSHQRLDDRRRDNIARDKLDRATVEQVLDPRTRMILFRLLSRNRLRTLDGCVSTGKEANVYYATAASLPDSVPDANAVYPPNPGLLAHDSSPDAPVAVKVFKTSILQFKDRERYVAGEFRFRRTGYQRSSNRKMVQQWAEKEFRNQMRLHEAGIPAPVPLLLKPPVLIMSFFGKDGWPAPRLKDAKLSPARLAKAYFTVCMLMRRMFRVAHLVHGDLSEYNMLYWNGDVVIIDVSQSVEGDHPMALDFLRRDCSNVNDFFRRSGVVAILGVRDLFDFVTSEHAGNSKEEQEAALTYILEVAGKRDADGLHIIQRDDEVFMRSYIPRSLQEVEVREQHFRGKGGDEVDSSLFARLTGLSLSQKRERRANVSKVTSVGEGNSADLGEATIPRVGATEEGGTIETKGGRMDAPNLALPCVEPTTSRLPLKDEQLQIRTSSPCTSNSSSRPHAEEREGGHKSGRIDPSWDQTDEVYDGVVHTGTNDGHSADDDEANDETNIDDDTFDANAESESSSDEWQENSRDDSPDPFMGLTRKEWKKKVKAEARERREHKIPKHVKKRKEALAKRRRGTK